MYTYYYKRHQGTYTDEFDTLAEAVERAENAEALNFEYEFPLKITTESGEVAWDNSEFRRKMGFAPE